MITLELEEDDIIRLLVVHLATLELMEGRKQIHTREYVMTRHAMAEFYYAVKDKVDFGENTRVQNLLLVPPPTSLTGVNDAIRDEKYGKVLNILRKEQRDNIYKEYSGVESDV